MTTSFLRLPGVLARTGLSRATIYGMTRAGTFPAQVRLGTRAVGWALDEIERWEAERIAASKSEKVEKCRNSSGTVEARS